MQISFDGKVLGTTQAGRLSEDLLAKGIVGNHRFSFEVPIAYHGKKGLVEARVIDVNAKTTKLTNSPQVFTLPTAPKNTGIVAGVFGGVTGTSSDQSLTLSGWAADKKDSGKIVTLEIRKDGMLVDTAFANRGPELSADTGIADNHRYRWTIPPEYYGTSGVWLVQARDANEKLVNIVNSSQTISLPKLPEKVVKQPFKIYWGFNTQTELLADLEASTANAEDVARLKNIADGYFFNVNNTGRFSYWPNRPRRCAVNDKTDGGVLSLTLKETINGVAKINTYDVETLINDCLTEMYADNKVLAPESVRKTFPYDGRKAQTLIGNKAYHRVIENLGLKEEVNIQGKDLIVEMLIVNNNFIYNSEDDSLAIATTTQRSAEGLQEIAYQYPSSFDFFRNIL